MHCVVCSPCTHTGGSEGPGCTGAATQRRKQCTQCSHPGAQAAAVSTDCIKPVREAPGVFVCVFVFVCAFSCVHKLAPRSISNFLIACTASFSSSLGGSPPSPLVRNPPSVHRSSVMMNCSRPCGRLASQCSRPPQSPHGTPPPNINNTIIMISSRCCQS